MNIVPYRSSFTVFVLDSDKKRCKKVYSAISEAGFDSYFSVSYENFFEDLESHPPHIVFLEEDSLIIWGESFLEDVINKLPEVHVIIYAKQNDLFSTSQFIDKGVYDCVAYNEDNLNFLVLAADRAAERDYFMYMNEQLQTQTVSSEEGAKDNKMPLFEIWLTHLNEKRSLKEAIDSFLAEVSRHLNKQELIYFKYVASHQSLIASQSIVADLAKVRGLGIDLVKKESSFNLQMLEEPMKMKSLKELIEKAFESEKIVAMPLMV